MAVQILTLCNIYSVAFPLFKLLLGCRIRGVLVGRVLPSSASVPMLRRLLVREFFLMSNVSL